MPSISEIFHQNDTKNIGAGYARSYAACRTTRILQLLKRSDNAYTQNTKHSKSSLAVERMGGNEFVLSAEEMHPENYGSPDAFQLTKTNSLPHSFHCKIWTFTYANSKCNAIIQVQQMTLKIFGHSTSCNFKRIQIYIPLYVSTMKKSQIYWKTCMNSLMLMKIPNWFSKFIH